VLGQIQTAARNNGRSDPVTLMIQSLVAPPAQVVSNSMSYTEDFLEGVRDANMLRRQNDRLTAELDGMKQYQETLDRLQNQLDALREMNDYVAPPSRKKLYANIIGYSPGQNSIMIDRGSIDGIKKYQPVIAAKGLVGIIEVADAHRSRVLLITSPAIKISAAIEGETRIIGIISGATATRLSMGVFGSTDVLVGASVVTSGISESIPPAIRIGIVIESVDDEKFGAKRVFVLPSVDLDELSEVFVLK
jgi:rod shape-determining protein MreC